MKPTVKLFLALAEDKEQTIHIARYKSDSSDGYCDEEVFCGKLKDVPKMTGKDYTVGGCTALIDAIGGAIHHIGNIHKNARPEDVLAHTMFIITTDGQENASHQYSSDEVKKMIEHQKEKYGWEFLFIGANIDAVETAARFGINRNRAVNYNADSKGTQVLYETLSAPISAMRADAAISDDWCQNIEEDYNSRK